MRRKITEAHLLLIITFAMYMGYQWLMQWIPLHDVMFHVIMGQVTLIFPGALWMLIRYRKNRPQLSERMLFTPISNANIKMAVAVIIPMLFVMAVMPAFNEEFLCRGILYGAYRQRAKTTGIWLSALAFGLFHLNFNQMLYAVYLGIVLALMVEATGSIYTSMLMHFLLNGFNVTMNFMANQRLIADAAVNQQQVTESVSQTLSDVPIQQLVTMAVVLAIFIFLNGILIYSTFRMNGRSLQNDGEKGRVIDGWIVIFVIITVILTYMNTDFL